ncbi:NAD(P)/FAD-dependent oxidoreductase [Labedaea rhizosphaerae]|uniref:NADH dehydrogenase FAD-containing subunit n=1 Tax=Labedaea rhizosphaerae TaxID=598644 RepID=A0A4R6SPG0_LABRH|nr:FAD-dependent oxidoreductase [Labedaea rhizosphaerae]TDQ05947.1 NADH dehydrogenase FAD-containing subunit [Labedaea rhizosphaerae]
MSDHKNTKVVVVGGGYAGALAANHLHVRSDVDVTLVNPRSRFVERIRLHQLAAGSGSATTDFARVLNPKVRLVVDEATEIDAAAREVHLASGDALPYDYLIYAVGSTAPAPAVPGAAEHALRIAELSYAEELRERVSTLDPDAPICVVGGGLTGIETAAELAARHKSVHLLGGGRLGPSLGDGGRASVARQLRKLGVTVLEQAVVTEVRADAVVLADGSSLPSALTVWTAGFGVPQLAARSGLSTDALGRLRTDETLTSVDDPRIVAAGDAAAPSDQPLRMSCQAALPLGAQAANTVLSRIAGTDPAALSLAFFAQCISLGRAMGTFQTVHADDRPRRLHLGGRTAAWVKEYICKGALNYVVKEGRKPGSYWWLKGRRKLSATASA